MTDLEEKTEKVLVKLTSIFLNMINLEDNFSIKTPTFMLIFKKSSLPFVNMSIEKNSLCLPGFLNLTKNKSQTNLNKQIIIKVNI